MTDPACTEANVQKDGTAIFATALKQAFLEPHVETVIRLYTLECMKRYVNPLKKVLSTFKVVCINLQ